MTILGRVGHGDLLSVGLFVWFFLLVKLQSKRGFREFLRNLTNRSVGVFQFQFQCVGTIAFIDGNRGLDGVDLHDGLHRFYLEGML